MSRIFSVPSDCCDRYSDVLGVAEEPRDSIPRDTVARQDTDDVQLSRETGARVTSPAEDTATATTQLDPVESPSPRPLFEDISDTEDKPEPPSTSPRRRSSTSSHDDASPPLSLFHSPVGSVFDAVQSWSCRVPDRCSSSLPTSAVAVCQQLFPDVDFRPSSPPPPPLEDLVTPGAVLPAAMSPLTIDTGDETAVEPPQVSADAEAPASEVVPAEGTMETAEQGADDVTDASEVEASLKATVTDQPPSFEDPAAAGSGLSPSPPKIPRLRIVMGAGAAGGDAAGQLTRSPGSSSASLPYVVTVDSALADDEGSPPESPPRDVIDDVTEEAWSSASPPPPSLVECASRQQRKVKNGAGAAKVRLFPAIISVHLSAGYLKNVCTDSYETFCRGRGVAGGRIG